MAAPEGEGHNPRSTHEQDQADALSRDQMSWELSVRSSQANALTLETHAALTAAKGRFWLSLGTSITWLSLTIGALLVASFFGLGAWR